MEASSFPYPIVLLRVHNPYVTVYFSQRDKIPLEYRIYHTILFSSLEIYFLDGLPEVVVYQNTPLHLLKPAC